VNLIGSRRKYTLPLLDVIHTLYSKSYHYFV
jgi:hypothetical protein